MSKRAAAVQLTADNVDDQDQVREEAGTFEVANEEEIQQRVIKKAKRGRVADEGTSGGTGGGGGIFAGLRQSLSGSANGAGGGLKLGMPTTTSAGGGSGGLVLGMPSSTSASTGLKLGMPSSSTAGLKLGMSAISGELKPGMPSSIAGSSASGLKLGMPNTAGSGLKLGMPSIAGSGLKLGTFSTASSGLKLGTFSSTDTSASDGPKFGVSSLFSSGSESAAPKLGMPSSSMKIKLDSNPSSTDLTPPKTTLFSSSQFGAGSTHQPGPSHQSGASAGPSSTEYLQQLSSLNHSVSDWISRHVKTNPCVDLTPIFRDYEAHLKNIDKKYNPAPVSGSETVSMLTDSQSTETDSQDTKGDGDEASTQGSGSSYGNSSTEDSQRNESVSEGDSAVIIIGSSDKTAPSPDKTVQSLSPAPNAPPTTSAAPSTPADDDSLFSVRAKLFYKKEAEFVDLGVGTLKVQSSSKGTVHLLMRNDTSLGTVLLNVKVGESTPLSRNKKSVLLVCPAPNPPLSVGEGPVTYLLRVKTEELAEQLLDVVKDNVKE